MSRAKWELLKLTDGSAAWHEYRFAHGLGYPVDEYPEDNAFAAVFLMPNFDCPVGPLRKTLRAAHNDCKRHAKKLRAALVEFDRAKLP